MTGAHITAFLAENIKKLRVVRITPDGALVQITGPNGSGKSSVLDAIEWALAGKGSVDPEPIRRGADSAVIRLELGDVTVTRTFAIEDGETVTRVEVAAASGAKFTSPQRILDELLGQSQLLFDPIAFERMKPKDRLLELRRVVALPAVVDQWDQEARAAFDQRTDVNRQVRDLEGQLKALPAPVASAESLQAAPPDIAALVHRMTQASKVNDENAIERRAREGALREAERDKEKAHRLRLQAQALIDEAENLEKLARETEFRVQDLPPVPADVDAEAIALELTAARQLEAQQRQYSERQRVADRLKGVVEKAAALTAVIEERQASIRSAIAAVVMPVDGLGFGDEDVLYNGIPFEQASGAERLRVALGVAMAGNTKLKVVRIKDGSLLDERSLALVAEMATAKGYQVWIERVDTSGKVGIILEDGEVKTAPAAP